MEVIRIFPSMHELSIDGHLHTYTKEKHCNVSEMKDLDMGATDNFNRIFCV